MLGGLGPAVDAFNAVEPHNPIAPASTSERRRCSTRCPIGFHAGLVSASSNVEHSTRPASNTVAPCIGRPATTSADRLLQTPAAASAEVHRSDDTTGGHRRERSRCAGGSSVPHRTHRAAVLTAERRCPSASQRLQRDPGVERRRGARPCSRMSIRSSALNGLSGEFFSASPIHREGATLRRVVRRTSLMRTS